MAILKQSTAYKRLFVMIQSADHVTGLTGASPAVNLSKSGAAFGASANSPATEIANGWYSIVLTVADTNTLGDLAYHITAGSADPTDFVDQIWAHLVSDLVIDAFGNVSIASNIKKNVALANFPFVMTLNGVPTTGLTITAQRSLDGAGFSPCANSVVEIASGVYKINLATTDLNANTVMLRFTATNADDRDILLITQP